MRLKQISILIVLIICFSCKNSNLDEGNNSISVGSPNSTDSSPEEQYSSTTSKEIEWSDGNTYTYDYTEEIETQDSLGVSEVYTIYRRYKPENVNCETKQCRWCGKEIYAENYSIEEFPEVNAIKEKDNYAALFSFFMSIVTSPSYFDIENKRIRTEWIVNCDYGSLDDFCSLKCKSEYNRR